MDPLAQLHDIQTPEQISNFPIAIGWWLLLVLAFIFSAILIIKLKQNKQRRKRQKQAIKQLKNNDYILSDTIVLLKWAAMAYFPRQEVAALSGDSLALYLSNKLPKKHQDFFNNKTAAIWPTLYQKNVNQTINDEFNQAALFWLKNALPPKASLPKQSKALNKQGEKQ